VGNPAKGVVVERPAGTLLEVVGNNPVAEAVVHTALEADTAQVVGTAPVVDRIDQEEDTGLDPDRELLEDMLPWQRGVICK